MADIYPPKNLKEFLLIGDNCPYAKAICKGMYCMLFNKKLKHDKGNAFNCYRCPECLALDKKEEKK